MIQYNAQHLDELVVAVGYAETARRLRESFDGKPWDDLILLPFLFVWRQAIELQLKSNIRSLSKLCRSAGDTDPQLQAEAVDKRLRNPKQVGHNLRRLIDEHDSLIVKLDLEPLPPGIVSSLDLLAALDNGGTGFRYAGVLNVPNADLSFDGIATALEEAFEVLQVVIDAATNGAGA